MTDGPDPTQARERPCQVCSHPDRGAIEQALLNGKGQADVARTFGIGSNVGTPNFRADHKKVARHIVHMGEAYRKAREAREVQAGKALGERMAELDAAVDEALRRAREGVILTGEDGTPLLDEEGKPRRRYNDAALLAAVREARANVDMLMRLAGSGPEGDASAVEAARQALSDPRARRMVADLEAMLAEPAVQRNRD